MNDVLHFLDFPFLPFFYIPYLYPLQLNVRSRRTIGEKARDWGQREGRMSKHDWCSHPRDTRMLRHGAHQAFHI